MATLTEEPENEPGILVSPKVFGILNTSISILGTRLLAFLALLGAVGIWGEVVADPNSLRLWAGIGYSVGVLLPIVLLYLKRG